MARGRRRRVGAAFTLIELMLVVSIVSLLSAVAIPTFGRYVRRAKTSEVHEALDKIGTGAATYFLSEHSDALGLPLPPEFPGAGRPAVDSATTDCCLQGGGLCRPGNAVWSNPVWQALLFSIEGAQRYRYTYQSWGSNMTARYRTQAIGDLDCDGTKAQWIQQGWIDSTTGIRVVQERIQPDMEIE